MRLSYLLIFLSFLFFACGSEGPDCDAYSPPVNFNPNVEADNIKTIESYLAANNLTAEVTENNLYYIIDNPGGNAKPDLCSSVLCNYTGYLPDSTVFDMSEETGLVFSLSGVIKGWQEGMRLYGLDGSGKLLIPSKLAYGSNPPQGSVIPENSVLIFDFTILGF